MIEHVIERSAKRLPVIAGTGTNDARVDRVHAFRRARGRRWNAGRHALLQQADRRGFDRTTARWPRPPLPLVLYNVPSRTGCDLKPATVACDPRATPTWSRSRKLRTRSAAPGWLRNATHRADRGRGRADRGVHGARRVGDRASWPTSLRAVAELCRVARPAAIDARPLADYLAPLVRDLFIETNLVPMKAALAAMAGAQDVRRRWSRQPANRERLLATRAKPGWRARRRRRQRTTVSRRSRVCGSVEGRVALTPRTQQYAERRADGAIQLAARTSGAEAAIHRTVTMPMV